MAECCPKCKHKSLRYRDAYRSWACDYCRAIFRKDMSFVDYEIDKNICIDENGNAYIVSVVVGEHSITHTKAYYIEVGKTTLRGDHPRFKEDAQCGHPERLSCNYGIGFERCEHMKYTGTLGNWYCDYKKPPA